jgi:phosphoglycolate phosphatase-like HAD superfamily hydrolase
MEGKGALPGRLEDRPVADRRRDQDAVRAERGRDVPTRRPSAQWEAAFAAYLREYERHLPLCAAFPGVAAALARLRERGVPLALVTGKSRPTALMSLKQFGLDGMFDSVRTGSPTGVVKAEASARVVTGWRVNRDQVIYVGDARDWRSALGTVPRLAPSTGHLACDLASHEPGVMHRWAPELRLLPQSAFERSRR